MNLEQALAAVKAAGYRVSMPRKRKAKTKDRVGPTFIAEFADGVTTRMSTFTSLETLDWERGLRLARLAYTARVRRLEPQPEIPATLSTAYVKFYEKWLRAEPKPINVPAIVAGRFEQDGEVLAVYNGVSNEKGS
jgi:hypothetical protein